MCGPWKCAPFESDVQSAVQRDGEGEGEVGIAAATCAQGNGFTPDAVPVVWVRVTVRVSPQAQRPALCGKPQERLSRARGLKNSLFHGVSSLRRRLPAGRARWRPRQSLGASEGAWPSPSPSTWRTPRTHPLARFPTGTGGLRFACHRVGGHAARKPNFYVAILCTEFTHHTPT